MFAVIPSSKSLSLKNNIPDNLSSFVAKFATKPSLIKEALLLVDKLRSLSIEEYQKLTSLNPNLAELNYNRYQDFTSLKQDLIKKPSAYMFSGGVYQGLDFLSFEKKDIIFATNHLGILSGLYGLLTPMDIIYPYRLPMGTKLSNPLGNNLYDYWSDLLSNKISDIILKDKEKFVLNLTSPEYGNVLLKDKIKAKIINFTFLQTDDSGEHKNIGTYSKTSRGKLAQYFIKNQLYKLDQVKDFNLEGYKFAVKLSKDSDFVFTRAYPKVKNNKTITK